MKGRTVDVVEGILCSHLLGRIHGGVAWQKNHLRGRGREHVSSMMMAWLTGLETAAMQKDVCTFVDKMSQPRDRHAATNM